MALSISQKFEAVASLLALCLKVPVQVLEKDGTMLCAFSTLSEASNPLLTDPKLKDELFGRVREDNPALYFDGAAVFYGLLLHKDRLIVIGPLLRNTENESNRLILTAKKHGAAPAPLASIGTRRISGALAMCYFALKQRSCDLKKLLMESGEDRVDEDQLSRQISNVLKRQLLLTEPHNSDDYENRIRRAVAAGDEQALELALNTPYAGRRGVVGFDSLRNAKNLAIVDITISSRAAIDAGADAETIYTIGDGYLLEVEKCTDGSYAAALSRRAAFEFCAIMRDLNADRENMEPARLVRLVRIYIKRHLSEKIALADIAEELGLSVSYLQKCFKKEAGMTIGELVMLEKIDAAKALLRSSTESVHAVSGLLGFANQAHFSRVFKEQTGMSPLQFRRIVPL